MALYSYGRIVSQPCRSPSSSPAIPAGHIHAQPAPAIPAPRASEATARTSSWNASSRTTLFPERRTSSSDEALKLHISYNMLL